MKFILLLPLYILLLVFLYALLLEVDKYLVSWSLVYAFGLAMLVGWMIDRIWKW